MLFKWTYYSVFTETEATQTMKTNQMAEMEQQIPTFSNPANQMSYFIVKSSQSNVRYKTMKSQLVRCDASAIMVSLNKLSSSSR